MSGRFPRHRLGSRLRDDRGSAVVEFTWLGVLLLIPLVWIVVSVFQVQKGAFAVSGAARAAGRAFALSADDASGTAAANAAARQALGDQDVDSPVRVEVSCKPLADCHQRGAVITVRVYSGVALPLLPDILGGGKPSFRLDSSMTEPIGRFADVG